MGITLAQLYSGRGGASGLSGDGSVPVTEFELTSPFSIPVKGATSSVSISSTRYFATNQSAINDILPLIQDLQRTNLEPKLYFPTESVAAITNFISANNPPEELR